jgi:phage-related tail fiber protein
MPTVDSGIITPGTGQITYGATNVPTSSNVPASQSSSTLTPNYLLGVIGANAGVGTGVYSSYAGNQNITLFFKSLVEGNNILLSSDNDTITVSSPYPSFTNLTDVPNTIIQDGLLYGNSGNLEFISAPTTANTSLQWNGTNIVWALSGSGTVQEITIVGQNGVTVFGSPVTTTGVVTIGLNLSGAMPGTYFAPTVTIDQYGRITNIQSELEAPLNGIHTLTSTYSSIPVFAGIATQIASFVSVAGLSPISTILSSDNSTILFSLNASGVTAGTYTNIVINNNGLITSARTISSSDIINALGYSPLNATAAISSTPNTLILRDTNGNATAASFIGNLIGNASTASSLQNSVNINLTGDIVGATSFNGASSITITTFLSANGVSSGTYNNVVVDATGRVTGGTNSTQNAATLTGDVNGSGTGTITTTLAASGVTPGTYQSVVVNTKGLVTSGGSLSSSSITNALGFTPVSNSLLGATNGIATLDVTGKLTLTQLPASIVGAVVYQGTWNASTNTPILTSSTGTKGYYYKVSVAGSTTLDTISQWNVGDTAIFDGTTWDKIDGLSLEVISVAGRTGVITLSVNDISGGAPLASPAFTGSPTAPTPTLTDSSSLIATTSFVKQQITTITGDVTGSGNGTINLTLTSTGVTPGTYNAVVVDAKGRIQSASNVTSTTDVTLTGDVTGTGVGSVATTLAATGVSAGTYTSVTVNTKGLVVSASQINSASIISALGYTPLSAANEGVANGLATLDSNGRLTNSQVPSSLLGALVYQGTWNAATNTPTLTSSTGIKGYYYKVSVAGSTNLDGLFQWNVGDTAIFDGAVWDKVDGLASEVVSVAGRTGAVILTISDVSGAAPLASPAFTGTPTAPTPLLSDSSTSVATTYFVKQQNYLTNNQSITLSGDASGTGTTSIPLTLATTGVTPGTYSSVVVDAKGRVISGSASSNGTGTLQNSFSFQVNFDSNGNVSSVASLPTGWTASIVNSNQITITHNLGLFPQSIVCFGNNNGVFTMKTPNGNPTGQFSVGITSSNDVPNTFTLYGVNSTAVNAAVSSFMLVQVLI